MRNLRERQVKHFNHFTFEPVPRNPWYIASALKGSGRPEKGRIALTQETYHRVLR
jgi:hypothetical protein